jgi:hypothetical protein
MMIYSYDFGDSWEHSIVLAKQLPADPSTTYPVCKDDDLARPPEGCGTSPGFMTVSIPSPTPTMNGRKNSANGSARISILRPSPLT